MITIFKTYFRFIIKNLFKSNKLFQNFDDLVYKKKKIKKQYFGQRGDLYQGRTFGILRKDEKTNKPTVPF